MSYNAIIIFAQRKKNQKSTNAKQTGYIKYSPACVGGFLVKYWFWKIKPWAHICNVEEIG